MRINKNDCTRLCKRVIESNADLTHEEVCVITSSCAPGEARHLFKNKLMALLFFNRSTRTRLSFIRAASDLGMDYALLKPGDLRLADTESYSDTGLAISQYADIIGIRLIGEEGERYSAANRIFQQIASGSEVPVINMECDKYHPCQGLADLKTVRDHIADYENRKIVISWAFSPAAMRVQAVPNEILTLFSRFIKHITLVHPPEFSLSDDILTSAQRNSSQIGGEINVSHDLKSACEGADVIYARNWVTRFVANHGVEEEGVLHRKYRRWRADDQLFNDIAPRAKYMHCMPIHRGYEASDSVVDGERSLIKFQMKNRVAVQKELIELLL